MAVITIRNYEQILLVVEAREGYLYNDFGGGNPAMCGIHSLRQCDRRICFDGMLRVKNQNAPLSVKKIWSESLEELLEHLRAHGKLFQYCRTGSIASPESTTPVRMTTANPSRHERNSVTTESEAFDVAWNDKECCLEVWSTDRLTFEPKGSLLELRNRVAHGVSGLVAGPNQYLVGTFISDAMDPVDTENVLYYNVGSANFNQASLNGISWCRSFEAAPRAPGNRSSLHYHRYELAPLAQEPAGSTEAVATWSGVRMPEMSSGMKPGPIWWDMKKADIAWSGDQVSGAFEMRLTLHAPAGDRTPASLLVKQVFDGIVAAFHQHDGRDLIELSGRLARFHGWDVEATAAALMSDATAVLGRRRLLWCRSESVQWNPGDDQCVRGTLIVRRDSANGMWTMDGELSRRSE